MWIMHESDAYSVIGTLRPDRSQHEDHFENELKCMN